MSETELRELDARIHREVMGLLCSRVPPLEGWYAEDGSVPKYSLQIEAAWLVVELLRKRIHMEYEFELFALEDGTWDAVFGVNEEGTGDTAPLAICLAALKAVEPHGAQ